MKTPLNLFLAGFLWPIVFIPLGVVLPLDAYTILIIASLGVIPFVYACFTLIRKRTATGVAILLTTLITLAVYWVYAMVLIYYALFLASVL